MEGFYTAFIAFFLVFFSELGDKTQLIVLSFSTKLKTITILLGVVLGSLLSHGIAILFGSMVGNIGDSTFKKEIEFVTYISFIIIGIFTLLPSKEEKDNGRDKNKSFLKKIAKSSLGYILLIAISIAVGELGDKTFLASIGLGVNYPNQKLFLILGAIMGMVVSDFLAIVLGKTLSKKIPENVIKKFSGVLFILFGIVGFFLNIKKYM